MTSLTLFQGPESAKYYKEIELAGYGKSSSQMMADTLDIKGFGSQEVSF